MVMKIASVAFLLMGGLGFVLTGCTENVYAPSTTSDQSSPLMNTNASLAKSGITHSLTGSANSYNIVYNHPEFGTCIVPGPKEKGGFYNVQTINAVVHSSSSVTGEYLSQLQGKLPSDVKPECFFATVHGKVIQLMVDEAGQAKVVVEITKWNGPLPAWMVEVFIDNGEGKAPGMPDRMSSWWWDTTTEARDFYLSLTPQQYIDWEWSILEPLFPWMGATVRIDNGNIQVH
jgi:hypothetical protein